MTSLQGVKGLFSGLIISVCVSRLMFMSTYASVLELHSEAACSTSHVALPGSLTEYTSHVTRSLTGCVVSCASETNCSSFFAVKHNQQEYTCVLSTGRYTCDVLAGGGDYTYYTVERSIPHSCADIQAIYRTTTDGEYCISIEGEGRMGTSIYCHDMHTGTPREYLTLPRGASENFSKTYKYACAFGDIFYHKVGLDLETMTINAWDDTFAVVSVEDVAGNDDEDMVGVACDSYPLYGKAFSCNLAPIYTDLPNGETKVDLRGTGFLMPDSVSWVAMNAYSHVLEYTRTLQTVHALCTGNCGGCVPQDLTTNSSVLTYYLEEHASRTMPIQYDHTLDPNQCRIV